MLTTISPHVHKDSHIADGDYQQRNHAGHPKHSGVEGERFHSKQGDSRVQNQGNAACRNRCYMRGPMALMHRGHRCVRELRGA